MSKERTMQVFTVTTRVSVCPYCLHAKAYRKEGETLVNCKKCYSVYRATPETGENLSNWRVYVKLMENAGKRVDWRGRNPRSLANLLKSSRRQGVKRTHEA